MRSSAYECRLAETHRARRLRLLGSPPDLVHSGPVVQGPHPYAEPRSKALSDLVCSTAQLGAYRYFIILCPELQGAFVWVCFFFIYDLNPPTAHSGAPAACGGGPLALSQFSLRAAVRPCENWSAAPASPRCICRRQRSAQLPPSGGAGLFHLHHPEGAVCGLEPLSRGGGAAAGQTQRPRPVDEAGSCVWRSAPVFASGRRPAPQKSAKRKRQTQRPRPVDEAGSRRWRSGLNMQASSLMRRIFRAPQEERRPNMQAGCDPRRIFG